MLLLHERQILHFFQAAFEFFNLGAFGGRICLLDLFGHAKFVFELFDGSDLHIQTHLGIRKLEFHLLLLLLQFLDSGLLDFKLTLNL